ncbi:MAG: hypothetical protein RBT78_06510 [Kiritimatiellia bacterium]|jgi:hypothetical protein|nr:hypothetical protein [Kiritimatiellia bacterium]
MRRLARSMPVILAFSFSCRDGNAGQALTPVLCLAARDTRAQGLDGIETNALAWYRERGFALHFDYYENTAPETLRRFPVVVGMLSQLHQGTSVFAGPFGGEIEAYVRGGGSFLFFSGPSYYGTADFDRMQNPFLERFGARLLREVPRAPGRERAVPRIVRYRYLRTDDIADSPYTGGARELYLPLDHTDDYIRTHTLCLSAEWDVLVTAGARVASYPHADWMRGRREPGQYRARAPVLALRRLGQGRFALFATASSYFVWEAGHPALGDGFVLRTGGLDLMTGLLARLAAESAFRDAPGLPAPPSAEAGLPGAAVPVMPEKKWWFRYVLSRLVPDGYGVRQYIDCGALSDLPHTPARGRGCLDAADGELLRSPRAATFHATAANARGVGPRPVTYRFGPVNPRRRYALGMLLWGAAPDTGRDLEVSAGGRPDMFRLPSFALGQAPRWVIRPDLKPDEDGRIDVRFARGAGGTGTHTGIAELWLFEEGGACLADPDEMAAFDTPQEGMAVRFPAPRVWKGLIGARSPADGGSPVADLAAAARAAGLDFLVFTDAAANHTDASYAGLLAACAAASAPACAVFAGVRFTARYAGDPARQRAAGTFGPVGGYVFHPLRRLPDENDYGNPSALFWRFFGGAFSGGEAVPPTLSQPGANGIRPWHQRFWRGFDVLTFDGRGRIEDDSAELYAELLASGYGPQPRLSCVYRTPADILAAARAGRFTLSAAPSRDAFASHAHATHATTGPVIRAFRAADDAFGGYGAGGGLIFGEPRWVAMNLDVTHTAALTRVTLFADSRPVRRWHPSAPHFSVIEPIRLTEGAEYRMEAEACDGGRAWSGRFQTVARAFATSMCADNQNTISTLFKTPARFVRDERELYLQHSYWHTGEAAGQLGAMLDAAARVPRVDEAAIIQPCKTFHPCPLVRFRDGSAEDHRWAGLQIGGRSADAFQIRYRFEREEAAFRSGTRLTSWRPEVSGATAVFVETTLEARRDLAQGEAERITLIDLALRPDLAYDWNFSVTDASGGVVGQDRFNASGLKSPPVFPFGRHALAGIWTEGIGNLFVLACDPAPKRVVFSVVEGGTRARERMTVSLDGRAYARGERATFRHMVLLVPGRFASPADVRALQQRLLSPVARLTVTDGLLREGAPVLRFGAGTNRAVSGRIEPNPDNPDPVPVEIDGVEPDWPLAVEGAEGLRQVGADGATLRLRLDPAKEPYAFAAGNLLWADAPGLRLEAGAPTRRGLYYLAHNPTPRPVTCVVRPNPAFAAVPDFRHTLTVLPGATVWRTVPAPGP